MPHVVIKMYKGRDEELKQKCAEKVKDALVEVLGSKESSISIDIIDIDKDDWKDLVYDKEIEPKMDELIIKPGYKM